MPTEFRAVVLLLALSCVSETSDAEPLQPPAPPSPPAATPAPSVPAPPPAEPPEDWISVADLPEVEIAEVPAAADWPTKVTNTKIEGWRLGRRGRHLPRGPHTNIAGLFAAKGNAKAFNRRGDVVPASNGTCFKVVWPTPERATVASGLLDREPVLMPEPHVFHRAGWDSLIGWVQGTRWLGVSEDGAELRLEIGEAWLHVTKLRAQRISVQEVTFRRVPLAPEGFVVFAARQDERVHIVAVPTDESGAPTVQVRTPEPPAPGSEEAILDPPQLRRHWPCAWTRFAADATARPHVAHPGGDSESRVILRFSTEAYDGVPGLRMPRG